MADISLSDYGVAIPGLQWFGRNVGSCTALANGNLRYDGEPTVDGSFARVEVEFQKDPGTGLQEPQFHLTLFPPTGSTITEPVVWERFGVLEVNRVGAKRDFDYGTAFRWNDPPACKAGFDEIDFRLTMVDPREHDLFSTTWELAACDT